MITGKTAAAPTGRGRGAAPKATTAPRDPRAPRVSNANPTGENKYRPAKKKKEKVLDRALVDTATWSGFEKLIEENVRDNMFDLMDSIQYMGFDPEVTFRALLSKAVDFGLTANQFISDMIDIVTIVAVRGTQVLTENAETKTDAVGFAWMMSLLNTYGINTSLLGDSNPANVSLGRVSIIFAEVISAILGASLKEPVCRMGDLPKKFCFSQAPSVMTVDEWTTYKETWLRWSVRFTRMINRYKSPGDFHYVGDKDDDTLKSNQLQFAQNARESSFYSDNIERKVALREALIRKFEGMKAARFGETEDEEEEEGKEEEEDKGAE